MRHVDIIKKYYTDEHNVNEDITTITSYGGLWDWASGAGIIMRFMTGTPSSASNVASRKNKTPSSWGLTRSPSD